MRHQALVTAWCKLDRHAQQPGRLQTSANREEVLQQGLILQVGVQEPQVQMLVEEWPPSSMRMQ